MHPFYEQNNKTIKEKTLLFKKIYVRKTLMVTISLNHFKSNNEFTTLNRGVFYVFWDIIMGPNFEFLIYVYCCCKLYLRRKKYTKNSFHTSDYF